MLRIYVDGSCINNGRPNASGGWAFIIEKNGKIIEQVYGKLRAGEQTNNRAELEGMLSALRWLSEHPDVSASIYADSKVVVDGLTGEASRKANRDLWSEIEALCPIVAPQIKGIYHIEREKNNLADSLAKKAASALLLF